MQYEHKPGFLTLSLFLYPSYNLDNASWQALDPQAMQPKAKDQQQSLEDNHVKTTHSASITVSVHLIDIINKITM